MSNELALRTNLTGLAAFAQDNDAVAIAGEPIYFKKGRWYRAQEAFEPGGLHFLVNHNEAYTGWTRWADKKPVEHRLVRCTDYARKEPREALGFTDKNQWEAGSDPWQPSDRIVLRTMDTSEDLLTFITSSVGGRNAIAKLLGNVARSVHAADGKMPVVVLEVGSYDHDDFGKVSYPIFKIVDWAYWDGAPEPKRIPISDELDDAIPF